MWEPVCQVNLRVTIMGREPWELVALLVVLCVTNLTSREWAGALGAIVVSAIAVFVTGFALKKLKQQIPPQQMQHAWQWLLSRDVYLVEREEVCKPLVLR